MIFLIAFVEVEVLEMEIALAMITIDAKNVSLQIKTILQPDKLKS